MGVAFSYLFFVGVGLKYSSILRLSICTGYIQLGVGEMKFKGIVTTSIFV